jgi:hypothetical protein
MNAKIIIFGVFDITCRGYFLTGAEDGIQLFLESNGFILGDL